MERGSMVGMEGHVLWKVGGAGLWWDMQGGMPRDYVKYIHVNIYLICK